MTRSVEVSAYVESIARDWARDNTLETLRSKTHDDLKAAACAGFGLTPEDACAILDRAIEIKAREALSDEKDVAR